MMTSSETKWMVFGLALGFGALYGGAVGCGDDDGGDTTSTTAPGPGPGPGPGSGGSGGGGSGPGPGPGPGPGSGGTGGMAQPATCMAYCADIKATCTAGNVQFAGAADCEKTCAKYPPGMVGDKTGDTLECRAYHVGAAEGGMADLHCPHAGPLGGKGAAGCGDTQCKVFCGLVAALCPEQYPNGADCDADCATYKDKEKPFVSDPADGTDSLKCRGYHLTAAAGAPDPHCKHVGGPKAKDNAAGANGPCKAPLP
jgi:hypothetical protein